MSGRRVVSGKWVEILADNAIIGPTEDERVFSVDAGGLLGPKRGYAFFNVTTPLVVPSGVTTDVPFIGLNPNQNNHQLPSNGFHEAIEWQVHTTGPLSPAQSVGITPASVAALAGRNVFGALIIRPRAVSVGPAAVPALPLNPFFYIPSYTIGIRVLDENGASLLASPATAQLCNISIGTSNPGPSNADHNPSDPIVVPFCPPLRAGGKVEIYVQVSNATSLPLSLIAEMDVITYD
jgi:hypothetical protein